MKNGFRITLVERYFVIYLFISVFSFLVHLVAIFDDYYILYLCVCVCVYLEWRLHMTFGSLRWCCSCVWLDVCRGRRPVPRTRDSLVMCIGCPATALWARSDGLSYSRCSRRTRNECSGSSYSPTCRLGLGSWTKCRISSTNGGCPSTCWTKAKVRLTFMRFKPFSSFVSTKSYITA